MHESRNFTLLKIAALRDTLLPFIKPEVLKRIVSLAEALGTDRNSFLKQFKFWVEKNGEDCRYAAMAKTFFLEDQANSVAKEINWLYHNWSRHYEEK